MARKPVSAGTVLRSRGRRPKTVKRASFFKVLLGDFAEKMRIPPAFIKRFDGIVPQESVLRSATGKVWHVEVKRVDNDLFFKNGWTDFVEENSLEMGEILIFMYQGNSEFDVQMFSKSGCEKEEASQGKEKDEPASCEVRGEQSKEIVIVKRTEPCNCLSSLVNQKMQSDDCPFHIKHVHFTATWRSQMLYKMPVPETFVDACGIRTKTWITLHDPRGERWPVKVVTLMDGRIILGSGWAALMRANGIEEGNVCGLECIIGIGRGARRVLQVHIFPADE